MKIKLKNKIILIIVILIILLFGVQVFKFQHTQIDTSEDESQRDEGTETTEETESENESSIDEDIQIEDSSDTMTSDDIIDSKPESPPVIPPNITNEPIITHIINKTQINGYTYTRPQTEAYLNKLKNNDNYFNRFEFDDYGAGLNELWFWYLGFEENYTRIYLDEQYTTYKLEDKDFQKALIRLTEVEFEIENYRKFIVDALSDMSLCTTDKDLVTQISKFIYKNFSFKQTGNLFMYDFIQTKQGQYYHYANLFKDMCNAVGIHCEYVEDKTTSLRAVNKIIIDEQIYYFDITMNDISNSDKYSWMSEEQAKEIYGW